VKSASSLSLLDQLGGDVVQLAIALVRHFPQHPERFVGSAAVSTDQDPLRLLDRSAAPYRLFQLYNLGAIILFRMPDPRSDEQFGNLPWPVTRRRQRIGADATFSEVSRSAISTSSGRG
jgi:hypothetical protein